MNDIPGFTAEASLRPSRAHYRLAGRASGFDENMVPQAIIKKTDSTAYCIYLGLCCIFSKDCCNEYHEQCGGDVS